MGDQNACIQSIDINKYVYINLVKVVLFKNHESDYQLNMNVDQRTHAIPIICTCKNVICIFCTKPMQ